MASNTPPDTVVQTPPAEVVDNYMARAQQIVNSLPKNDKKGAINRLDRELNNPYFASDAATNARRFLTNERSNLSNALAREEREEAEKRLALNRKLQDIRGLINNNAFLQARQQLNAIKGPDRESLGNAFTAMQNDLRSAENYRRDAFNRQIAQASNAQQIDEAVQSARREGLSRALLRQVESAAQQRKKRPLPSKPLIKKQTSQPVASENSTVLLPPSTAYGQMLQKMKPHVSAALFPWQATIHGALPLLTTKN